jgi:hypothetical protein
MGEILKYSNSRVLQTFTRETLNRVKTSPCCLLTENVVNGDDSFQLLTTNENTEERARAENEMEF